MSVSINGTNGLTFADSSTQNTAATGFGFKNRIINGQMQIDQRNAGASVTNTVATAAALYTLDRWGAWASQASKYTVQQNAGSIASPAGFKNYLGVTSSSAYTVGTNEFFTISQQIEGLNVADLAWGTASAATVSLSFWVRSSLTGTFGGSVQNGAANRSYPFTYTILSANTWEQKSITIAGDTTGTWLTTNGIGMYLWLGFGVGTTYSGTAGSWSSNNYISATGATSVVGTNGATFYITGVQLEKGSTATSFDYRPYGTELALCQRYYERFTNSGFYAAGGAMYANQPRFCVTYYPKRAIPSFGSSAGSTFIVQGNGSNQTPTGFSVAGADTTNTYLYATGTTLAVGLSAALGNGTTSYLEFPAEL